MASSIFMAEALAIREACQFSVKVGIKNVSIKSDCKAVVKWCSAPEEAHLWDYIIII